MTDLHDRFRSLDHVPAPDLWHEATQRAALPQSRDTWRVPPVNRFAPLALAVATAGVAILIGIGFLARAPSVGPAPTPTPAESAPSGLPDGPGRWVPTGQMTEGREGHSATLLDDGTVLVAGGGSGTAELYDPRTGSWTATGELTEVRSAHTATLLEDGRVLVVGGRRDNTPIGSAELYDPATGSWSPTGPMNEVRGRGHTATLLPDGRVLVAGGYPDGRTLGTAELYDPSDGSWTATADMPSGRAYHTATLLLDSTVLVAGGLESNTFAVLYDPATGTWSETGSMVQGRHDFTATLLPTGMVLVAAYEGSTSAELYDPASRSWSETGSMTGVRLGTYRATLLRDGTVLVTGGVPNRHSVVERYFPSTGTWTRVADTTHDRHDHTATLLPDGRVLVAGGSGTGDLEENRNGVLAAELYVPGAPGVEGASVVEERGDCTLDRVVVDKHRDEERELAAPYVTTLRPNDDPADPDALPEAELHLEGDGWQHPNPRMGEGNGPTVRIVKPDGTRTQTLSALRGDNGDVVVIDHTVNTSGLWTYIVEWELINCLQVVSIQVRPPE